MNGIRIRPLLVSICVSLCFLSCLQTEKFVQPVFVYEPHGALETISVFKSRTSDLRSDSEFSKILNLDDKPLGPFGMVVFANTPARELFAEKPLRWDPYPTNYSELNLDVLELDGESQVALMKDGVIVDLLSSTDKPGWAADKTLIRRKGIKAYSKSNDFTRADAGWITKVAGYEYNLGEHRYLDTDPDFDSPAVTVRKTILDIRNMPCGRIEGHFTIVGRVTSDRATKNVSSNRLFMQDGSNRGICVEFKEGQAHEFNPGDEVSIKLYGSELVSENGLLVLEDCLISRTDLTRATWQEIDRVFSLPTADGKFTGKVTYPFLKGYCRKPGVLGTPGNIIDVQNADYTALENKRNRNDFESVQCNPVSGGAANWIAGSIGDVDDLGVHSFSIR